MDRPGTRSSPASPPEYLLKDQNMHHSDTEGDAPLPEIEVSPEKSYEFQPDTARTVWFNLIAAAVACLALAFLLHLPRTHLNLTPAVKLAATLGLGVAVFLILSLPHFAGDVATRVKIFPRGLEILRRDGSRDIFAWPEIRGYVYTKDYLILITQDESVSLKLLGFSQMQLATMRSALRLRLAKGSLKWRGRAAASLPRGINYPVIAATLCLLVGGVFVHFGHRKWAVSLFILVLAYLLLAFIQHHRKQGPG